MIKISDYVKTLKPNNCKECKGIGLIVNPKTKRLQECPVCTKEE